MIPEDKLDIELFISVNRKVLKLTGLYPTNFSRYFTCLFCMLLFFIPEICEIYLNRRNMKIVLETSSVLLTFLLTIIKSLIWNWKKETKNLVNFLFNDYWRIAILTGNPKEIYQYARLARRITIGYSILIVNALLLFYSTPLVNYLSKNSTISFPFLASYPKICYQSPMYEIIFLSQIFATSVCAFMVLGTDTLIATAIFHTCGHFSVLQKNLNQFKSSCMMRNSTRAIEDHLNSIVEHHQIVIKFSESMENVFSPMMLIQVFASSLIICLIGFQMNPAVSQGSGFNEYVTYLMMALFQLFMFCWPGNELIKTSSMVSHAAYSTSWYLASSDCFKKKISFIIFRGQKASFISAGKFGVLNLEYFSSILSTSLSYFTLLRNVQ